MSTEIPRETAQLDHNDTGEHGQGGEKSNATRENAASDDGEDQKEGNETDLHPHEDSFRRITGR
jgi:hypothetical protein